MVTSEASSRMQRLSTLPFGAIIATNREAKRMQRECRGTRIFVFSGAEEGTCRSALPG